MTGADLERVAVGIGLAVLVLACWWLIGRLKKRPSRERLVIPSGVLLQQRVLLTPVELKLYNLIRMATQDEYLVFGKVPLRFVVSVEGEGAGRLEVLRRLGLKHVDFALVHPGSRVVAQCVLVDDEETDDPEYDARREEIQRIVEAAGMQVAIVKSQAVYTVEQLQRIFNPDH